jgi:hypothetical protein
VSDHIKRHHRHAVVRPVCATNRVVLFSKFALPLAAMRRDAKSTSCFRTSRDVQGQKRSQALSNEPDALLLHFTCNRGVIHSKTAIARFLSPLSTPAAEVMSSTKSKIAKIEPNVAPESMLDPPHALTAVVPQPEAKMDAHIVKSLCILLLLVFVDVLAVSLLVPLLPHMVTRMGAQPVMVGVMQTSFGICQLIGAPITGRLSDRYGRRFAFITSNALSAFSYFLSAFATSVLMLIVVRVPVGLSKQTVSVAYAYVSDCTTREQRSTWISCE